MNSISVFQVVIKLVSLVRKVPVTWPHLTNSSVTANHPYLAQLMRAIPYMC